MLIRRKEHGQCIVRVDHKLTRHCDDGGRRALVVFVYATVAVLVKFANNEIPRGNLYVTLERGRGGEIKNYAVGFRRTFVYFASRGAGINLYYYYS